MKQISTFVYIVLVTIFLSSCGDMHSPKDTYTVGIVNLNHQADLVIEGFYAGMEKRGYVKGKNIHYVYPGPLDSLDQAKKQLNQLTQQKVDLIYTITTPATKAAQKITKDTSIPVIFGPIICPVSTGLVKELYSPENDVSGVRVRGSTEKAFSYLKELLPGLTNIYVPVHEGNGPAKISVNDLKKVAADSNVNVLSVKVKDKADLKKALVNIPSNAEAIWVTHSYLLVSSVKEIVEAGKKVGIPVATPLNQLSEGVLVTYAPYHTKIGDQVSRLADKILQGIEIASVPVETAEFYLGINLETADQLGIEVPEHLIQQADEIIR